MGKFYFDWRRRLLNYCRATFQNSNYRNRRRALTGRRHGRLRPLHGSSFVTISHKSETGESLCRTNPHGKVFGTPSNAS